MLHLSNQWHAQAVKGSGGKLSLKALPWVAQIGLKHVLLVKSLHSCAFHFFSLWKVGLMTRHRGSKKISERASTSSQASTTSSNPIESCDLSFTSPLRVILYPSFPKMFKLFYKAQPLVESWKWPGGERMKISCWWLMCSDRWWSSLWGGTGCSCHSNTVTACQHKRLK